MLIIGQVLFDKTNRSKCTAEEVVVKVLEHVENEDISQKVKLLNKLAHPNTVHFKGICLEHEFAGVMLE